MALAAIVLAVVAVVTLIVGYTSNILVLVDVSIACCFLAALLLRVYAWRRHSAGRAASAPPPQA